jgi:1-acyl-sn-glycerol-3-phosphate acyltransferase
MTVLNSTAHLNLKSSLNQSPVDFGTAQNLEQLYQQSPQHQDILHQETQPQETQYQQTRHRRKVADPALSRFSPWLLSLVYPLGRYLVLPLRFGRIQVTGQENLPLSGPVILAPTHRSRWDSLMVPYAAGYHVTKRHLRYMVSADEVTGLQGWFIRRLGGFPVNTLRPAIASLRHGVELLEKSESLVIFPEGNIFRDHTVQPLKPGLARLAIQAKLSNPSLDVKIVPMSIHYDKPLVPWGCKIKICIGPVLHVTEFCTGSSKKDAKSLTDALQGTMEQLVVNCIRNV